MHDGRRGPRTAPFFLKKGNRSMKTRTELVSQAKLLIAQANALQPNASTRLYVGKVSVTK